MPNDTPSPDRTRRPRLLPWMVAIALGILLALGLRPRPAPVETAVAGLGPLRSTLDEEGKTRIRQRYVVAAPVSGRLRRIELKPGARIASAETVVAVLEPAPASPLDPRARALARARRDAAAALLAKARQAHELAASEVRRMEAMRAAETVSEQSVEAAEQREVAAASEIVSAEGALEEAEAQLSRAGEGPAAAEPVAVAAGVAGTVLRVFQESERVVSQGTPLLEIGDPTDLEVVIEMLSRDGAAIAHGARVELGQWGGSLPLEGRVRLVEPAAFTKISALGVEEQRVNVVADILTPLAERASLGDGFRVEARVVVWESDEVLKVPASALFRRDEAWAAFVVRGGRAELTPVEVGRSSGSETQILAGLEAGDEVVLYPSDRIDDGQRVAPIEV